MDFDLAQPVSHQKKQSQFPLLPRYRSTDRKSQPRNPPQRHRSGKKYQRTILRSQKIAHWSWSLSLFYDRRRTLALLTRIQKRPGQNFKRKGLERDFEVRGRSDCRTEDNFQRTKCRFLVCEDTDGSSVHKNPGAWRPTGETRAMMVYESVYSSCFDISLDIYYIFIDDLPKGIIK